MIALVPLLLVAAPAAPASQSILVLDLAGSDVDKSVPRLLTGLVTDAVAKRTAKHTLAQADLRRVMALEADRQAVGCDSSSCLGEMANALGVDYVVFGDVGKLGNAYVVTLRLFDAKKNDAIGRESIQAPDIDGLRIGVDGAVAQLVAPLAPAAPGAPPASSSASWFVPGLVVAGVGALGAVGAGGGALYLDGALGDAKADAGTKSFALDAEGWLWLGAGAAVVVAVAGGVVAGLSSGGAE